jgi:hypothetical protein
MKISADELKQSYRSMSDVELLDLDRDDLTEVAQNCLDQELQRRGLSRGQDGTALSAAVDDSEGRWMSAGVFHTADEAQIVRGLLESNGIPARVFQDPGGILWRGSSPIQTTGVLVPEAMSDEAHGLIEAHLTEQELSARSAADPLPTVILARFEDGVFKPLEEFELEEGAEVEVHLSRPD